ncbi:hypothetical protein BFJ63_vAg19279 [Fusarium oxysporum f. sp. narcissi]|uniref:FAD-binding domain-containing protein n=1 Tax=Fusarium oxysporum f. sp. narcissi TaxID=451672 RepID=A0A4Q2UZY2_FUSOX|nr:hypothetical protein BFJ63_vAg19279 [Fusarium oxysporum f. sp. narcissi]
MEESYRGSYDDFETRFKFPWYFSHRVDLHNELKRLALEPWSTSTGAKLHLSTPVVDVDCEGGILKFEDSTTVTKDVIIGADGVHSLMAKRVIGSEIPATEVEQCIYRFLIPTSKLLDNPITRPLFEQDTATFRVAATAEKRIAWYPCRKSVLYSYPWI